jgi:hypothetical protein
VNTRTSASSGAGAAFLAFARLLSGAFVRFSCGAFALLLCGALAWLLCGVSARPLCSLFERIVVMCSPLYVPYVAFDPISPFTTAATMRSKHHAESNGPFGATGAN